eukprot:SAG31_NODE_95_length_25901_cov_24.763700_27_plen_38_part_00
MRRLKESGIVPESVVSLISSLVSAVRRLKESGIVPDN